MDKPKVLRTDKYTEDKLREIAEKPGNSVYHYVYETPETVLSPETQLSLFQKLIAGFDAATHAYPLECTEALRERVLRGSDAMRLFQRLYPKVFASCTVRVLNEDMHTRLDKARKVAMLMLLERVQGEGTEEEKAARAMYHGMRVSMRDTVPSDLANGTQNITAAAKSAGMPDEAMKPLDVSELGPSSVRQSWR